MSLVARQLEAEGIATLIIGSAKDIVEHCGVPRFLFVDFPLGNPAGPPYDRAAQAEIAAWACDLMERADGPRSTVRAPIEWPDGHDWRARYNRISEEKRKALQAEGEARRAQQARDKAAQQGLSG